MSGSSSRWSPDSLAAVVSGLVGVVNEPGGTAYGHRLKDIVVAGQDRHRPGGGHGGRAGEDTDLDYWQGDHAWFAAFAPADNPEIAVVVLNEHGGYGAAAAAPTAMAVIQAFFEEKKADEARRTPAQPPRRRPREPARGRAPAPPEPPKKKELGVLAHGGDSAAHARGAPMELTGNSPGSRRLLAQLPLGAARAHPRARGPGRVEPRSPPRAPCR